MSARTPPKTPQEALALAGQHARAAAAESVSALHALLDAAALAGVGEPAVSIPALAPIARVLEDLARELHPRDAAGEARLLAGAIEALGEEIQRWEARARDDPEARAVLRTLIGLRELLWEAGVRPNAPEGRPRAPRPAATRQAPRAARHQGMG